MVKRVVFGVPVLNGAAHLEEALGSLLAQSDPDFGLVVVDNCSSDATPEIAKGFAERDSRVRYRRNPERLGMVDNWNRTYDAAVEEFGSFEYFAFGSDHDVWDPEWLAALAAELDADPALVLAYPVTVPIQPDGTPLSNWGMAHRLHDTAGVESPAERVRFVSKGSVRVGNIMHGLVRARALERCGVISPTCGADRFLIAQLAVLGTFKLVPRPLWKRRFWEQPKAHPRTRLFEGRPPAYTYLPIDTVQTAMLFRWAVVEGGARPEIGRLRALRLVAAFASARLAYKVQYWHKVYVRSKRTWVGRWIRIRKRYQRTVDRLSSDLALGKKKKRLRKIVLGITGALRKGRDRRKKQLQRRGRKLRTTARDLRRAPGRKLGKYTKGWSKDLARLIAAVRKGWRRLVRGVVRVPRSTRKRWEKSRKRRKKPDTGIPTGSGARRSE